MSGRYISCHLRHNSKHEYTSEPERMCRFWATLSHHLLCYSHLTPVQIQSVAIPQPSQMPQNPLMCLLTHFVSSLR